MILARYQELKNKQIQPAQLEPCSKALLANHPFNNIQTIEASILPCHQKKSNHTGQPRVAVDDCNDYGYPSHVSLLPSCR